MQTTIKKFGIYAAVTSAVLFLAALYFGQGLDFSTQEVLGYLTIFASLTFVFFGIKHFRDKENDGLVSFKKAFIIGIIISLFAALGFGVIDGIYVGFINPDFGSQYLEYTLEGMKTTLSPEEFEIKKAELTQQMEAYSNPFFTGMFMFFIVFVIGIIVSLLSALILQRKS